MYSAFFFSTYGVMSYSHFCDANSAVQITSEENMSQSPDLASWRCTNDCRCWPASGENSTSSTVTPVFLALNVLTQSFASPAVSLPWQ